MKSLPLFSKILVPDQYCCIFCNRELKTPNPHGTCGSCMVKLPFIQNPSGEKMEVSNHEVEALIVPMITEQGKVEVNVAIREHM